MPSIIWQIEQYLNLYIVLNTIQFVFLKEQLNFETAIIHLRLTNNIHFYEKKTLSMIDMLVANILINRQCLNNIFITNQDLIATRLFFIIDVNVNFYTRRENYSLNIGVYFRIYKLLQFKFCIHTLTLARFHQIMRWS